MKANELRIGNWVIGIDGELLQISPTSLRLSYVSRLKPIPLTPEILEKCGFSESDIKDERCNTETGKWFYFTWSNNNPKLGGKKKRFYIHEIDGRYNIDRWHRKHIDINHLHQLQNLYWCLCGQELEVNL